MARKLKDSGIEWIGEIPEDWKISKIKYVTKCFDGRRIPVDASLRIDGIYPYWGAGSIQGYVNDYIFDEEIVLLGEDGAPFFDKTRDVAFLINEKVWVNNHIHVLNGTLIKNEYLVYFLNIVDYTDYINGSILNKLTQGNMKSISIVYPPTRDQINIIELLREKTSKIEEMKIKINKQIQTLEDYKKSVITESVTKGLDENVEMKDSGIEWIGEIPKHWKTNKLGRICNVITDFVASGSFASLAKNVIYCNSEDYAMLVRTVDLSNKRENIGRVFVNKSSYNFLNNSNLFGGEIVLPNIGASVGDVYIVPKLYNKMTLGPNSIMVKTKQIDKYYYYCFLSKFGREMLENLSISSAQAKFNKTQLRDSKLTQPPIKEQNEIVTYLDEKCSHIDGAITAKQKQLEILEEYKKSLIYEYVTGKKEVEDVGTI